MPPPTLILTDENATARLGAAIAPLLRQKIATGSAGAIFLTGDLGAGKTTFARYLLQNMGVTGAIKSPTYTLIEPYDVMTEQGARIIYHADLYRLDDPLELELMGFFEYLADSLVLIEWASKGAGVLPPPMGELVFWVQDDGARAVQLLGTIWEDVNFSGTVVAQVVDGSENK